MPWVFAILFFITAILYASVGFGGGSTYTALLALSDTDYRIFPTISLCCNILVVTGGLWRFYHEGLLKFKATLPFLVTSIPAAWFGGQLIVSETLFIGVLGFALLISGLRLLKQHGRSEQMLGSLKPHPALPPIIGGGIGFLAGIVGIGGGIFLAPILYSMKWGTARQIAATCCLFIFTNSISGLFGQLSKLTEENAIAMLTPYWLLFPAVILGGQIGSYFATKSLKPLTIKRLTAVLILYVSIRLFIRWFNLIF